MVGCAQRGPTSNTQNHENKNQNHQNHQKPPESDGRGCPREPYQQQPKALKPQKKAKTIKTTKNRQQNDGLMVVGAPGDITSNGKNHQNHQKT